MSRQRQVVFLIGEMRLVREFGELCHGAGFVVHCSVTGVTKRSAGLPKHFKRSRAVPKTALLAVELTNLDHESKEKNLRMLDRALPPSRPILSTSITMTVTSQCRWIRRADRLVGIGVFPTLLNNPLVEIAPSVLSSRGTLSQAQDFLIRLGKQVSVVQDRIGMVMPRILCMLVNEAFFAQNENIATPSDIDTAMKLGTNHPLGPIEWTDRMGIDQVIAVLDALHKDLGEERYRTSPLLRQLSTSRLLPEFT